MMALMIAALSLILAFQLVGEVISRLLDLPLPGPVIAMVLLVAACLWRPSLAARIRPVTEVLLANLSLFFIPAGVGVIAHIPTLREYGLGLAAAIVGSTILAIAAGALAFSLVARWTGATDPSAMKDGGHD